MGQSVQGHPFGFCIEGLMGITFITQLMKGISKMADGLANDDPTVDWELVYGDLRRIAEGVLRRERVDHTLQPTALVNEVFLRFNRDRRFADANRVMVVSHAARAMRDVLVEHARRKKALKRGGAEAARVPLDETVAIFEERAIDLLGLDEALTELEKFDAELSRLVTLRFFGGLTEVETAEVLGVSERTVRRGWSVARAWLNRALTSDEVRREDLKK